MLLKSGLTLPLVALCPAYCRVDLLILAVTTVTRALRKYYIFPFEEIGVWTSVNVSTFL